MESYAIHKKHHPSQKNLFGDISSTINQYQSTEQLIAGERNAQIQMQENHRMQFELEANKNLIK